MRNPIRPGFGLPGGKVGVVNGVSVTVKCLIFSQEGLLIVKEKSPQTKSRDERTKTALSLKEIRHRIWKLIARRRESGNSSVDTVSLRKIIEEVYNAEKDRTVLLSAVREILEETGILIRPRIIKWFDVRSDTLFPHQVAICLGEIVSGKLKKELGETFNNFLRLYDLPPTDGEKEAENVSRTELMYYRHKIIFMPPTLKILLKENYQFPFSKMEIEDFLKTATPA